MSVSATSYHSSAVYKIIADRFYKRHRIKIADHIDTMTKLGVRIGQGFSFVPNDMKDLRDLIVSHRNFRKDNTKNFCDYVAALATKGEGFREIGAPSLHCQITDSKFHVHLDMFGFVAIGPDGKKYFTPDAIQHIIDELGWAKLVEILDEKAPPLGQLFGRVHLVVPNTKNRFNQGMDGKIDLAAGAKFNLYESKNWTLAIEKTVSLDGVKKTMVNVELFEL